MRKKGFKFSLLFLSVFIFVLLFMFFLSFIGVRINTTKSIPIGIYKTVNKKISVGDYVIFCPPNNVFFKLAKERHYIAGGFCENKYGYMMKKVLAAKKDIVEVTKDGVKVNSFVLPHSKIRKYDVQGKPLITYKRNYILKEDEVLLMSDSSDTSYDGRYFGPVKLKQIRSVIRPLFLLKDF